MDRLDKQIAFCLEADKEKQIYRQTYVSDGSRRENDAEHAWHIALMAILLREYANEEVDILKTVAMLLIHDIVEIDAGDTYAYDTEGAKTKEARETAAADRLFGLLPDDQRDYMRSLWDEFEERKTPEAKFANALDRVQPVMLNAASGGMTWSEHGANLSWLLNRNKATAEGSEKLWEYSYDNFVLPHVEKGNIEKDV